METPERGELPHELSPKRIRGVLAGTVVVDSTRALLVWERPHHPAYYFPREDVRTDLIAGTGRSRHWTGAGQARLHTVRVAEREAVDGVLSFPDSPVARLRDHLRFRWKAVDSWFEEDEEVYVHPRDPYVRIDILASSRRVRAELGGVVVAESTHPRLLFETGLPPCAYLSTTDVRLDLLEPSDTVTRCPYKGTASYHSIRIGDTLYPDVAWSYATPFAEAHTIAGMTAFHTGQVAVEMDGVRQ
ncbi:DUF427 domain-containing protein [Haloechinothrix sp. LS1_15]|uniref:DUF427 domain-containing protein n=1 Tax=Haloechinothrix sp. LS1_15 TaxID=2652248 RepID=UPI002946DE9F|nr:DUF427 domain-containing protein [Haloechinothrix sp. LS1_15]MDV6013608.1 DUF427 domain-containing protein [Haloechinothrix sp. LS1_15]